MAIKTNLPGSDQLRQICKTIYPQKYRNSAKVLCFTALPNNLSRYIHSFRDIEDLEVPIIRVIQCLGLSAQRVDDEFLTLIVKKMVTNHIHPSLSCWIPTIKLCNRSFEQYLEAMCTALQDISPWFLDIIWQHRDIMLLFMYWNPRQFFMPCSIRTR